MCGEAFEAKAPNERYCPVHRRSYDRREPTQADELLSHTRMRESDFPQAIHHEVRRRILEHNIQASGPMLVARIRAVGEAAREKDRQGLRSALMDLAAIATQAAATADVERAVGAGVPVIPIRHVPAGELLGGRER